MRFLFQAGRSLLYRRTSSLTPKRNVALDKDNYSVKHPELYVIIPALLLCAYNVYLADVVKRNDEEFEINSMSLAERPREPDLKYLRSHDMKMRR